MVFLNSIRSICHVAPAKSTQNPPQKVSSSQATTYAPPPAPETPVRTDRAHSKMPGQANISAVPPGPARSFTSLNQATSSPWTAPPIWSTPSPAWKSAKNPSSILASSIDLVPRIRLTQPTPGGSDFSSDPIQDDRYLHASQPMDGTSDETDDLLNSDSLTGFAPLDASASQYEQDFAPSSSPTMQAFQKPQAIPSVQTHFTPPATLSPELDAFKLDDRSDEEFATHIQRFTEEAGFAVLVSICFS